MSATAASLLWALTCALVMAALLTLEGGDFVEGDDA